MSDSDKIVAAIFAASFLSRKKSVKENAYLDEYDRFINLMQQRKKENEPAVKVTPDLLARARQMPPRRKS